MHPFADQLSLYWVQLHAGQFPALGLWSYPFLALLVLVEGPVATLLGAAAASAGLMRPAFVFIAAAMGNVTSDVLWYLLGRAGMAERLLPYGRWLGLRPHHVERLVDRIHAHARKLLFVAKLSNAFIIPALMAAGVARVPIRRWLPALLAAETLWTGALVVIGYYFTQAIAEVKVGLHYIPLVALALVMVAIVVVSRRALRRSTHLEDQPPDATQPRA